MESPGSLALTPLGCGGAPIGGLYHDVSDDAAEATLEAAWQAGIRYFDTAPLYGLGLSEKRMGRFLRAHRRGDFVVSTKVGRVLGPGREIHFDFSADGVRRAFESSLERMGLSRVDIVYIHDPDDHLEQALREAFPAVRRLRDEGIVRAVGVGMNQAAPVARFVRECDPDVVMIAGRYTLLDQSAGIKLLPLCAQRGVRVAVAGAFNSGILAANRPQAGTTYDYREADPEIVRRAQRIGELCEHRGCSLPAAAIAFARSHPAVASVVLGMRSPQEVSSNVAAASEPVPPELWDDLRAEGLVCA